jgi:hypothetical protein
MSLGPDREPVTRPVGVWLEIAARLEMNGEGALTEAYAGSRYASSSSVG